MSAPGERERASEGLPAGANQPAVRSRLRVRYAETDAMGVVYHANYLVWFEVGRTDLMVEAGAPYHEMEAEGVSAPVVEATCRYRHPARFADEVEVVTRLVELEGAHLIFQYEVIRISDGRLLADGRTVHALVGADGRPLRLRQARPALWERLAAYLTAG